MPSGGAGPHPIAAADDVTTTRSTPAATLARKYAQRALARRNDEIVFVLWRPWWKRRCNVQHVLRALDGSCPTVVAHQVGRVERQSVLRIDLRCNRGAHLGLSRRIADRRADFVAAAKELDDAPARNRARAAGNENFHAMRILASASRHPEHRVTLSLSKGE